RQPWLVDLSAPGRVVLHVDTARMLPETDPLNRQITVGLGCFLELMAMAAAADGYRVTIEPFPEGETPQRLTAAPVAVATFVRDPSVAADPLFAQVLHRRSHKQPFDTTRTVPQAALDELVSAGRHDTRLAATNDDRQVAALRTLTHQALLLEIETPRTYRESVDLFRIGKREIEANPDGIAFAGPLFETLALAGQFDREVALDTKSSTYASGIAAVLRNTDTAMAHIWLTTAQNGRRDQIAAGRDWLRVNLAATALGLGLQPLSQAVQEYPEMAPHYRRVHEMLAPPSAPPGATVQMLGRLGFGPAVPRSPRWPIEAKLIGA
ncbi:MAG TPA: twin-arginine translocation pathway signal protein, partial [Reyranella sp.]|nr:twin-arginine translocation pathway signal protein [Reyranella sp.]